MTYAAKSDDCAKKSFKYYSLHITYSYICDEIRLSLWLICPVCDIKRYRDKNAISQIQIDIDPYRFQRL